MKKYLVILNGKGMADFNTLKGCVNYCKRKNLKNTEKNWVYIIEKDGPCYHEDGTEFDETEY